jgi:hypothetical protein
MLTIEGEVRFSGFAALALDGLERASPEGLESGAAAFGDGFLASTITLPAFLGLGRSDRGGFALGAAATGAFLETGGRPAGCGEDRLSGPTGRTLAGFRTNFSAFERLTCAPVLLLGAAGTFFFAVEGVGLRAGVSRVSALLLPGFFLVDIFGFGFWTCGISEHLRDPGKACFRAWLS